MRLKTIVLSVLLAFMLFPGIVFAADYQISGKILDQKSNPIVNGAVVVTDSGGKTIGATISDFSGSYGITIPQGTYSFSANGPRGTNMQPMTLTDQTISAPRVLNFVLSVPAAPTAKKTTILHRLLPVILGILVLLMLSGEYMLWRQRKSQRNLVARTKIQ